MLFKNNQDVEKDHSGVRAASVATLTEINKNSSLVSNAQFAAEKERKMTLLEGLKLYPKACAWSILVSTAVVMEGFDVVLIATLFGVQTFNQKYGEPVGDGTYQLSPAWQAGLTNGANVGEIIGLFINGIVADRFGYRKTMIGALFLVICFIFIPFFAQNVQTLLIGEILCGIPWGIFQTLTTTYAAEIAPVVLRAYLCTYVNLCWVFGQLIASGVLRAMLDRTDQWSYRIPFALQWMWPIPLIIGCYLAPESPYWLVRQDRIKDAEYNVNRLITRKGINSDFDEHKAVALMVHTNEMEKSVTAGTTYWDCFKGVDLRRTEIISMVWVCQNWCGSSFMAYSSYFLIQAGLASDNAFDISCGQYAIGAVGTLVSWVFMKNFGRRTLYVVGLGLLSALLFIIGCLGIPSNNTGAQWAVGAMLLVFTFIYDSTVGPVCYSIVAEMPSTRLRQKAIVIARNFYNVAGIVNNIIVPKMLNPTAWNWAAKSGFFWSGVCFLLFIYCYFRLPEPKGRTYGDLDVLFERRISARRFKSTVVDPFHNEEDARLLAKSSGAKAADIQKIENAQTVEGSTF